MDDASRVREKIDIVSLISEYIPLKKVGRNFTAICPFHNEKSPSFVVSPERQIWHCFGCGKGGDVFTFLMDYENIEFIEALKILAKKAGVEIKDNFQSPGASQKEKIYKLNALASEFYSYVLFNHPVGKTALNYLVKERELSPELIKNFNLGFAPAGGTSLSEYLTVKKKYKKEDLVFAGLSFQRGPRISDFFRNRIMFPLSDHRGNVVGFSGRYMGVSGEGPKYINTKETLVYHKGSMFFGLNAAKEEIKIQGSAIIMEGEFDVISSFKEGIKNAVAIKGTALTESQALLLSRFTEKITLCLDKDMAGLEATKRSLPILEKGGLSVNVVLVEEGKDPDEAVKKNPSGFKKSIKNSVSVYDFLIDEISKKYDLREAEGKRKITDEILPLISQIQNEIIKEHYFKKLSEKLDTSLESLQKQEKKLGKKEDQVFKEDKKDKRDRRETLEEYLVALVVQAEDKEKSAKTALENLSNYYFKTKIYKEILDSMNKFSSINEKFNMETFSKDLRRELLPVFDKCFLLPLPEFENFQNYLLEIKNVSKTLESLFFKGKIKEIGEKLKSRNFKNENEKEKLQKEFKDITSQLSSL